MGKPGGSSGGSNEKGHGWPHQSLLWISRVVLHLRCVCRQKVHGMQALCKGAPIRDEVEGKYKYGGMWGRLRKLMRRIHPKTGEAMEEHRNQDGSLWGQG